MQKLNAETMTDFYRSMLKSLVYCFLRDIKESDAILSEFDKHCPKGSRVLVFNIELDETPDGVDFYINDRHIHIAATLIRSKKNLIETIMTSISYLLGVSNLRSGMTERICQRVMSHVTTSISISASGKNGYNIFFSGGGSTGNNFPIDYNDIGSRYATGNALTSRVVIGELV